VSAVVELNALLARQCRLDRNGKSSDRASTFSDPLTPNRPVGLGSHGSTSTAHLVTTDGSPRPNLTGPPRPQRVPLKGKTHMSTGLMTTTASPARPPSRDDRSSTAVGMFPGLGSRAAYRNLDRSLLDSGIPAVTEVYRAGAQAMGFGDRHDRLIMVPKNLPQGRLAQQGFIGGAFVVHNLALHAHLNATAALPVAFSAYTGESFGILLAAAASGALEVEHCVALGHIFTPLMLLAAEGPTDEPLAQQLIAYQPDSLRGSRLVPEPAHVVAVRADPSVLTALRADIEDTWGAGDVELHKIYSSRQINLYVHPRVRHDLAAVVAGYAGVELEELKTPTTFLAHSQRMPDVVGRAALVFTAVADVQINVNLIAQSASVGSCGVVDISFTLPKVDLTRAVQVLDRHREVLGYTSLIADNEVGRVSIIGTGMRASPKLHAKFFSALTAAGINVGMMSTSDIQLSVIVEANDVEITVIALSTAFSLDESSSTVEASPDHFWRSTELRAGHQRPPYYRSTRWTVDT